MSALGVRGLRADDFLSPAVSFLVTRDALPEPLIEQPTLDVFRDHPFDFVTTVNFQRRPAVHELWPECSSDDHMIRYLSP